MYIFRITTIPSRVKELNLDDLIRKYYPCPISATISTVIILLIVSTYDLTKEYG